MSLSETVKKTWPPSLFGFEKSMASKLVRSSEKGVASELARSSEGVINVTRKYVLMILLVHAIILIKDCLAQWRAGSDSCVLDSCLLPCDKVMVVWNERRHIE